MATHPDYSAIEGAYRRGYLQAIDDVRRASLAIDHDDERMTSEIALTRIDEALDDFEARLTSA